jgi:hypothetical protein
MKPRKTKAGGQTSLNASVLADDLSLDTHFFVAVRFVDLFCV